MNKNNNNNSYLKNGGTKKDKEIKKYKRRSRALLTLLIIVFVVLIVQLAQNMFQSVKTDQTTSIVKNYLNQSDNETISTANCPPTGIVFDIEKAIDTFMDKIFIYPGGFWLKFFIFLGIIYLIQVMFSLVFDVIELILLTFVAIKRLIVWIYRKLTGRGKYDKQLKKIAEL